MAGDALQRAVDDGVRTGSSGECSSSPQQRLEWLIDSSITVVSAARQLNETSLRKSLPATLAKEAGVATETLRGSSKLNRTTETVILRIQSS
jgi:hypothetical protein